MSMRVLMSSFSQRAKAICDEQHREDNDQQREDQAAPSGQLLAVPKLSAMILPIN